MSVETPKLALVSGCAGDGGDGGTENADQIRRGELDFELRGDPH